MPFEPLLTDEKLEGKGRREKSMDDLMLAGCTGFVGVAVATYLLGVWPFLLLSTDEDWRKILFAFPLGLLPAAAVGAYASRRFGLAAACGFLGGAMALSVFLHLIGKRTLLAVALQAESIGPLSTVLVYLIPAGWILLAIGTVYVFLPKSELEDVFLRKRP